jgi:hypothetical protein
MQFVELEGRGAVERRHLVVVCADRGRIIDPRGPSDFRRREQRE